MRGDVLTFLARAPVIQLFFLGAISRWFLIPVLYAFSQAMDSYDSCETFFPPDRPPSLNNWDSVHFYHIARHGYSHDYLHAFFPLLPAVLRLVAAAGAPPVAFNILNGVFFGGAVVFLRELSMSRLEKVFSTSPSNARECGAAVLLFLLCPAAVFTVATYTESLYCFLTFGGLCMFYCRGRPNVATALFFLATCCRSNGIVNVLFIAYPVLCAIVQRCEERRCLATPVRPSGPSATRAASFVVVCNALRCAIIVAPYFAVNYAGYALHCPLTQTVVSSPVCRGAHHWTGFYQMLQKEYWSVGWFSSYTMKNSPNFLIAFPAIFFPLRAILMLRCRDLIRCGAALQFLLLWMLCVTQTHIQVINRVTIACPALYWVCGRTIVESPRSACVFAQLFFAVLWIFLGALLFSNHLPWT